MIIKVNPSTFRLQGQGFSKLIPRALLYPAFKEGRGAIEGVNLSFQCWIYETSPFIGPDLTDSYFNGKLQILQKKNGYRFSVDAVLLSQFVRIRKNERVIDLGTGCGILPLLLSQTAKAHSFVGVEIQKGLVECARKNLVLNHLEDRISILRQDFRE